MLPINSYMHPYINHALMKLNGRGQTKTGATIHPSKRGAGSRRSERSMHSVRSRGRRHRKRRLVRELGASRQGKHPWWFSPDDRDWLCSPDRSRRCVSLHMLVTAAEFLLGPNIHSLRHCHAMFRPRTLVRGNESSLAFAKQLDEDLSLLGAEFQCPAELLRGVPRMLSRDDCDPLSVTVSEGTTFSAMWGPSWNLWVSMKRSTFESTLIFSRESA